MGHRREYEPRQDKRGFQERVEGALADVGMYRNVSYRDLVESQFGGHPYTARRAVDRMIRDGHVREHQAKGPRGGTYKVLTLTEAGARKARDYAVEQGFDKEQQTWSGLVKRGELSHDTAVYRAARIEQRRLLQQGARIRRVRIDAEMKKQVARATETARATEGRAAADAARRKAAQDLELPMQQGRVVYPDAQIEYLDSEGRSGRVNVEIASEHYSGPAPSPPKPGPDSRCTAAADGQSPRSAGCSAMEGATAESAAHPHGAGERARSSFELCNPGKSVSDSP